MFRAWHQLQEIPVHSTCQVNITTPTSSLTAVKLEEGVLVHEASADGERQAGVGVQWPGGFDLGPLGKLGIRGVRGNPEAPHLRSATSGDMETPGGGRGRVTESTWEAAARGRLRLRSGTQGHGVVAAAPTPLTSRLPSLSAAAIFSLLWSSIMEPIDRCGPLPLTDNTLGYPTECVGGNDLNIRNGLGEFDRYRKQIYENVYAQCW